jgi:predicted Zn-dependent peptidase
MLCAVAAAMLAATPAAAAYKPQIQVEEFTLPNGMRFLLFERHESPTIAAAWVAKVGSVNERPGITGLSHFFEHMMFKGTRVIGTRDAATDLQLIVAQERLRDQMRAEVSGMRARLRRGEIDDLAAPEHQTPRYRELERQFQALVDQQRKTIVKDELDQIYTRNGGEGLNAFTSEDMTAYFVRLPANRLELWAWLESDRLLNPVFREFYSERDVVFEERRLRTESTPLGKFDEAFNALFWEAHPYKWPVVGWPSDIPSYTKAQADTYFATYYAPNNLTGVLVGAFESAAVKPLLERYFGRIPRGRAPVPEVVTLEPTQLGERRFNAEAETSPTLRVWWKAVPFVHRDRAALDVLTDLLSGRTGRLYKGLVLDKKLANDVEASTDLRKYAGLVSVECVVKDDQDVAQAEQALHAEIDALRTQPVPAEELRKVKNRSKADAYRRLSSPFSIMIQLAQYEGLGDWRYINNYADELEAVTAADVQRVAQRYLARENRTVGVFLRKPGGAGTDAELAALPAPLQAQARPALQRIAAENDGDKLRALLAQLQASAGQAPAEARPLLDLLRRRAEERLAALQGDSK